MNSYYLDELTNAGLVVKIDGRELRFSELRVKDYARMQEHLRRIQPKPSDMVSNALVKAGASPEQVANAMTAAYEMDLFWPVSIDTRLGMNLIQNDQGSRAALIRYALEKHHPDISESEAAAIAESMPFRLWCVIARFAANGTRPDETTDEEPPSGEPRKPAATGTT